MYRVVMDRERWFKVVMGEKFKVDVSAADNQAKLNTGLFDCPGDLFSKLQTGWHVDAKLGRPHQGFAGKFQENAFIDELAAMIVFWCHERLPRPISS